MGLNKIMMNSSTPITPKKRGSQQIRHKLEYRDFVVWIATPKSLREPATQGELAKQFGIGEDTLSDWKNRLDFWDEVVKERNRWTREKTSDVIHALYKRASESGGAQEVRLWMEIVEGLNSKQVQIIDRYAEFRDMTSEELEVEKRRLENFFTKKSSKILA